MALLSTRIFKHLAVINAPSCKYHTELINELKQRDNLLFSEKFSAENSWMVALNPVLKYTGIILTLGNALEAHIGYTPSNNILQTRTKVS